MRKTTFILTLFSLNLLCLNSLAQTNDDCAGAIPLEVGTVDSTAVIYSSNQMATDSGLDHPCAYYQGADVWFSFVAPAQGEVLITMQSNGGMEDSGMALYENSCDSLSLLLCDDDGGTGALSEIEANQLIPGNTYKIAVWSYGNVNPGAFGISVNTPAQCPSPSPNSFFAFDISANSATIMWEPLASQGTYTIVYGQSGFNFANGSEFSGQMSNQSIATLEDLLPNTDYEYYWHASCANNYSSETVGPMTFSTDSQPPLNDELCAAEFLEINAQPIIGNNSGATSASYEASGSCWAGIGASQNESLWYRFVAPSSGIVIVSTDFLGMELHDTQLAIYELPNNDCTDYQDLVELVCDTDGGNADPFGYSAEVMAEGLTEGQTYYVQVDGYFNQDGEFMIQLMDEPATSTLEETVYEYFILFPNPTRDAVKVNVKQSGNGPRTISIVDVSGKVIREEQVTGKSTVELDLTGISNGVYTVRVRGEHSISSQGLIIQ